MTVRPELIGHRTNPLLPRREHGGRDGPRILQGEEADFRHGVHRELERGGHTEVASSPTLGGPQEIRIILGVGDHVFRVRGHHANRSKIVARQSVLAAKNSDAASEGEAGNSDGGTGPSGQQAVAAAKDVVDVNQLGS